MHQTLRQSSRLQPVYQEPTQLFGHLSLALWEDVCCGCVSGAFN
jgi:hypothetical protein